MKKIIVLLLVIFLIIPSLSLNSIAEKNNVTDESSDADSDQTTLLQEYLRLRFRLGYLPNMYMGKYFYNQIMPPTPIQSSVNSVTLKYNKKTYFDIGAIDPDTGNWTKMISLASGYSWGWMNKKISYSFELAPFENSSMDAWNIQFDPPIIELYSNRNNLNWPGADSILKTNVSIMLKSDNVDPSLFTQDIVLKVNIIREELLDKMSTLKGPPDYIFNDYENYLQKEREALPPGARIFYENPINIISASTIGRITLFIKNLQQPTHPIRVDSTVEVLIKVDKYHLAEIMAPETVEIEPYEVMSIPVNILNRGSHIDTFNFNVNCDNEDLVVVPPPSITLEPGEVGEALVGVAAPRTIYSLGDLSSISVDAYSVDDPGNVFSNVVTLQTKGVNTTGGSTINIFLVVITLFVALLIVRYLLVRFKNKDKNREKEIETKTKKEEKGFFSGIFKKEDKLETKPKKVKVEEKSVKEEKVVEPKVKKPEKPAVDKKLEKEKLKKQKAIEKIKKQQKNK